MEQDAATRGRAPDAERSGPSVDAPRARSRRQRELAAGRMADAARAAHAGFRGPAGGDGDPAASADDAGRVRAVDLLFEPTPVADDAPAAHGQRPAHGPAPAPVDAEDRDPPEVWNPFRRARAGAGSAGTAGTADAAVTGPTLDDLHVRRTSVRCTAIATVRQAEALGHGTGTGDATPAGSLRAVADATIAARRVLAGAAPPMVVVRVEPTGDGREVAVTLTSPGPAAPGRAARSVGRATVTAGTEGLGWATAIATLRALGD